jgi:hypothetical protein
MARVYFDHVSKRFGSFQALKDFHQEILDKEFLVAGRPVRFGQVHGASHARRAG